MEKYTTKDFKDFQEYYPRWEKFVLEAKDPQYFPKSAKIEDQGTVYAEDGTAIDMKFLKNEMESAKTAIVSQSPLFAAYVHNFTAIYTWLVPTMATDGIRLFVNPKFANELTWEQKIFVIIHEIMHCVLLHMERQKGRDPRIFNVAGDLEINPLIVDTFKDFDEAFVKNLHGLYDKKYLNLPVEAIYRDIMNNMPNLPPPPNNQGQGQGQGQGKGQGKGQGQGQGGGGGVEINVGTKVKIRATGKEGVVSKVNPDGTYEVDEINESFYPSIILESYTREQIVPIIEDDGSGDGEGGEGGEAGEEGGEGSGGSGKGKPSSGGAGGAGNPNSEVIYKRMAEHDPAGTGGVISPEEGRKIAEESGYDVEGGEAGADIDVKTTWNTESGKLMKDLAAQKSAGKGGGGKLLATLERLHKGDVNWIAKLRRYVANALSPEQYFKLGSKKHLGREYLKRGLRQKSDALRNVVILLDTSGSMYSNPETIPRILNEINQIVFSRKIKKIHLAFFDSKVLKDAVEIITPSSSKSPKVKQAPVGGGTMFQPALDWVDEEFGGNVALCIFITDGFNADGAVKRPRYSNKFIWLIYDNPGFEHPFGVQINILPTK